VREHAQVLRLASIFVLGYVLPYSTGNEFYLLQNAPRSITEFDPVDYVLRLSLEERIAKSSRRCADDTGSTCCDADSELAFYNFLHHGICPLLNSRPVTHADVLHVMAMVICARYNDSVATTPTPTTRRRMTCLDASQFQVNSDHRLAFVILVRDHLALSVYEDQGDAVACAVDHLRASLRSFAKTCRTSEEARHAYQAIVAIVTQTRNEKAMLDEWDFLLLDACEDKTSCKCGGGGEPNEQCSHAVREELLSDFLVRSCCASGDHSKQFLIQASSSLRDAIEWQLDCMSPNSNDIDADSSGDDVCCSRSPCLLASLLRNASSLFYLFPLDGIDDTDEDPCESLTEASLQLLRHYDLGIAKAAANIIVRSIANRPLDAHLPLLFETAKIILEGPSRYGLLDNIIAVTSHRSSAFGSDILCFLFEMLPHQDMQHQESLLRLVAVVSANAPLAASKKADMLMPLLQLQTSEACHSHIIAALLSLRQAQIFVGSNTKVAELICAMLLKSSDRCMKYQMAQHALLTGNYAIASRVYDQLAGSPLAEKHFLWISSLECIARAESSLAVHASKGIPAATTSLRSALSLIQSLQSEFGSPREDYVFQMNYLILRLDFLDLTTVLRQLTREMRLTGSGPKKGTRTSMHLQNTVKSFSALSSRCRKIFRRYGMSCRCGQSISTMKLLRASCLFMAKAAQSVFAEVFVQVSAKSSIEQMIAESKTPLASLVRQLDDLVVRTMDVSVDPIVRAAAMLELIDGVLMAPLILPKDFFSPKSRIVASLQLSGGPEEHNDNGSNSLETIEGYPMVSFSFVCSGHIPATLLEHTRFPCGTLLIWYRIVYKGSLEEDTAAGNTETDETLEIEAFAATSRDRIIERIPDLSKVLPIPAPLLANGMFYVLVECLPIADEGLFTIDVKLGCKDVAGNEWELPTSSSEDCRSIGLRISRSH
jgi:hypothetical protein